jgi:hypothetical protein
MELSNVYGIGLIGVLLEILAVEYALNAQPIKARFTLLTSIFFIVVGLFLVLFV